MVGTILAGSGTVEKRFLYYLFNDMKFVTFGFEADCPPDVRLATRKKVLRIEFVRLCAPLDSDDIADLTEPCSEIFAVSLREDARPEAIAEAIRKLPGVGFAKPA